jgi:magnesium chelatase family protein
VTAKRALEIAAAGGHNLLMVGPPGSGKSMLAACLPGILPPMQSAEILESSMIASLAGKLPGGMLCTARPFRDPHHSASMAAMVGGGKRPMPGEISLAHHGVLFMDELPEFPSHVLEALRQPLETRQVTISRASAHVTYPARFQLIAAMNPCRCGYVSQPAKACSKAPLCAGDYQARLSGPLLDRIDLHVEVPEVPVAEMFTTHSAEASSTVAARVARAREVQRQRFERAGLTATYTNSDVSGERIRAFAEPDPEGQALLLQATDKLGLSMRGLSRVLKTARTIADLAGSAEVHKPHLAEALSYRQLRVGR